MVHAKELKMAFKKLNVHDIIHRVADNATLQMQEAHVQFTDEYNATNAIIEADEVHLMNIILFNQKKQSESKKDFFIF